MTLEELDEQIRLLELEIRLRKLIDDFPDSLTRIIFKMRLIDRASWEQIAAFVGGKNTALGVRMRFFRYRKKLSALRGIDGDKYPLGTVEGAGGDPV